MIKWMFTLRSWCWQGRRTTRAGRSRSLTTSGPEEWRSHRNSADEPFAKKVYSKL